jgi:8-oxo-dGTP pyrophosphatase MutT (NUDIX family)
MTVARQPSIGIPPRGDTLVRSGTWGPDASWGLWLSRIMPPRQLCTAVACVAIANLDSNPDKTLVVLTRHKDQIQRPGLELPAGTIDPQDRDLETTRDRECNEEIGGAPYESRLFLYRKIVNHRLTAAGIAKGYPPLGYNPYFYGFVDEASLGKPTGKEIAGQEICTQTEVDQLASTGEINPVEYLILQLGVAAAQQDRGLYV